MKRWTLVAVAACALALPGVAAAQDGFDGIVVFGTSLSDPGNAFALVGGTNTPPDWSVDPFLVPDRPYAKGGHHFSNGATWIEQLARSLGHPASAQPAFRGADPGATNYAVGGARARDVGTGVNLSRQVGVFLRDFRGAAPSGALYVIEIGSNDVRDALQAAAGAENPAAALAAATAVITPALGAIGHHITALYSAGAERGEGARKFLLWNVPDIGLTPAARVLDGAVPGAAANARLLTQIFNSELDRLLMALARGLPGIEIARLDVHGKLNEVVADPAAFGLSNVQAACITPGAAPFQCKAPDTFLFWDGIHPTRAAHAILAREAAAVLAQ